MSRREAAVEGKVKEALEFKQEVRPCCTYSMYCIYSTLLYSIVQDFLFVTFQSLPYDVFCRLKCVTNRDVCVCIPPARVLPSSYSPHSTAILSSTLQLHNMWLPFCNFTLFEIYLLIVLKMDENSKREAEELEVARTKHEKSLLVRFCPPHTHCTTLRFI